MNKQIIINVVKYDVHDKVEVDNIGFRCHNPCKAKKQFSFNVLLTYVHI